MRSQELKALKAHPCDPIFLFIPIFSSFFVTLCYVLDLLPFIGSLFFVTMKILVALCLFTALSALRMQHEQSVEDVKFLYYNWSDDFKDQDHHYIVRNIKRLCFGGTRCFCSPDRDHREFVYYSQEEGKRMLKEGKAEYQVFNDDIQSDSFFCKPPGRQPYIGNAFKTKPPLMFEELDTKDKHHSKHPALDKSISPFLSIY